MLEYIFLGVTQLYKTALPTNLPNRRVQSCQYSYYVGKGYSGYTHISFSVTRGLTLQSMLKRTDYVAEVFFSPILEDISQF